MRKMVKYKEENGELNQTNQRMTKQLAQKVKMAEKPEDAGNVPEFEKIIRSNKKNILDSVPPKYNISDFKEAYGNISRNLQTKSL